MAGSGGPTHTAGMSITESWTIISGAATPNPPAAADGAGNSLCVDVETGALVDMDHEVGPNPAGFASWSDYLATVARNIEGRTGIGGVWA